MTRYKTEEGDVWDLSQHLRQMGGAQLHKEEVSNIMLPLTPSTNITTGWCDAVYTSSITNLVRKGDTTHFVPPNARHVLPFGHTSLLLVCACCVYLFTLFGHT